MDTWTLLSPAGTRTGRGCPSIRPKICGSEHRNSEKRKCVQSIGVLDVHAAKDCDASQVFLPLYYAKQFL
jgi:hypothetical protein